jgi:hypothetical protein
VPTTPDTTVTAVIRRLNLGSLRSSATKSNTTAGIRSM